MTHSKLKSVLAPVAIAGFLGLPLPASAQTPLPGAMPGPWTFGASLYGFLPSISGSSKFPVDGGGNTINVDVDDILSHIDFVFMGGFEVHNGRWGAFTDLIYFDVSGDKQQSRNFSIGNIGLPATTASDLSLDLKGLAWTLAGQYRAVSDPGALTLDLIGGARLLDAKQTFRWSLTGELGPIAPAASTGSTERSENVWDAIVGIKGRYALGGPQGRWSIPFYADIGAGQSDLTWQVSTGITYAFSWGELNLLYRHLAYEMKSDKPLQDLSFSGPQFGVSFRW